MRRRLPSPVQGGCKKPPGGEMNSRVIIPAPMREKRRDLERRGFGAAWPEYA
jgi:hypothetical protein